METAEQERKTMQNLKKAEEGQEKQPTKTKRERSEGQHETWAAVAEPGNDSWGQAEWTPVRERELASPSPRQPCLGTGDNN